MSNPQVPESTDTPSVDDVVESANEGLAEAAAAADGATSDAQDAAADAATEAADAATDAADAATAATEAADAATDAATDAADAATDVDPDVAAFEAAEREHPGAFDWDTNADAATEAVADTAADATGPADADLESTTVLPATEADDNETHVIGAPKLSDDAGTTRVVDTAVQTASDDFAQPVFVQAPEPPRDKGNRATAGLIGLVATIIFAVLYLGATWASALLNGDANTEQLVDGLIAPLTTVAFWVPVAIFFLGFWFLGAFINRGRWGKWVIFGLLVGVIAWGGHIVGALVAAPFWTLTARDGLDLVLANLFSPLSIAAFIIGRELTIWFGAWVAGRGQRKKELNAAAQAEYERTIEAGPTLS